MLIGLTSAYLLARGLPGVVQIATLAASMRLLRSYEYGQYTLVLAGVGLVNVLLFQWLRLVFLRLLGARAANKSI